MINPLFEAWWNTVKDNSEFRGCTMPAAYAAWLAGKHSEIKPLSVMTSDEILNLPATPPIADNRKREGKQGRYRGDKLKGAEEKIKQMENPDAKE